jgi:DNA repair protein RecO
VYDAYRIVEQKNYSTLLPLFTIKLLTLLGYIQPLNSCSNCHASLKKSKKASLNQHGMIVCGVCCKPGDESIPLDCLKLLYFAQSKRLKDLQKIDIPKKLHSILGDITSKLRNVPFSRIINLDDEEILMLTRSKSFL